MGVGVSVGPLSQAKAAEMIITTMSNASSEVRRFKNLGIDMVSCRVVPVGSMIPYPDAKVEMEDSKMYGAFLSNRVPLLKLHWLLLSSRESSRLLNVSA